MHKILKPAVFVLGASVLCYISFKLGNRQVDWGEVESGSKQISTIDDELSANDKNSFERGTKLAKQTSAIFRAADSNYLIRVFDEGRSDEVRRVIENGMWISIVPMDELLHNSDASEDDRMRVGNVLPRLVEYYHENPKKIEAPKKSEVSEDVIIGLKADAKSAKTDPATREVLEDLSEAAEEPLNQLDGIFDAYLSESHKYDLETQEVLNRHIAQRNFPSRTWEAAGMTFLMPRDSGGGGSTEDSFNFDGEKLSVLYEDGDLLVDDKNFGTLTKGDIVDLRLVGHVFVNNVERYPTTKRQNKAEEPTPNPPSE